MAKSLKGKVVLITGASSGFGADAARIFAKEGCRVVLAARRMERLQALVDQIRREGGEALAIQADVSLQADIDAMVKAVLDHYGRVDILFNNAGFGRLNWLEELDPEKDIDRQLNVNLTAVIQVTRAVLPVMYKHRSGHIINMSSMAGWVAPPLYSIYSASKFGVRGFTDALRREAAVYGVKVSGIYPGPAVTEFSEHTGSNAIKRNLKLSKFFSMSSEMVARRTVWLAKHPRRQVLIPWYYNLVAIFTSLFPGLVDWILIRGFVRTYHRSSKT